MLRVDVLTIFPRLIEAPLGEGIVHRAIERGLASVTAHDLRQFASDRHRTVDDAPFGGGPGMVMKAEPFYAAMKSLGTLLPATPVVMLSPRGRRFDQRTAERWSLAPQLVFLCGRYEGIDERVAAGLCSEEASLGDFVLTGGEVAALAMIEAVVRLLPGALGDSESAVADSFADGLLDHPHYTRPADFEGRTVPDALMSGNHETVRRWRRKEALRATIERRPDLLQGTALSDADRKLAEEIAEEASKNGSAGVEKALAH